MNAQRLMLPVFIVWTALFSSIQAKDIESALEESLALRRISEYWKEKDYSAASVRINEFLSKHPGSCYTDQLYAMLGDLHFQEKDYARAIAAYDVIREKEFQLKCQFHRLHSLYEMGKYEEFILSADLFLGYPSAKADEVHVIRFELAESYFCTAYAPENTEKKRELLKSALGQYQKLAKTKFFAASLNPQAQIHSYLEEYAKAASLYLQLSQQETEKKEDWLFQAAHMQLHFNRNAAIDTFGNIVELGGKNVSRAALNQLNLLFQEKRYKDYITLYDKLLKHIPEEKLPQLCYYLGKSQMLEHNFTKAIDPLSESLASESLDVSQKKNALLALSVCAKELQDITLFEEALSQLKSQFAGDKETLNSLLTYAGLCQSGKQWAKSREAIEELLKLAPDHPEREALIYDCALLLGKEEKWHEGACAFEAFVSGFPDSGKKGSAVRHLLNFRLEDLKLGKDRLKQESLLNTLEIALEEKKTFSSTEKKKMRCLLGRVQYELCRYEDAIDTLGEYVSDFSQDPSCWEAYLLLAHSHLKDCGDEIEFILNAEKALALNPRLDDLHLLLFNTYLKLAGDASYDEKQEMVSKAADHLYLALDKPVNIENQRWLAGYYFGQFQNGEQGAASKAAHVLEKLLGFQKDSTTLTIDEQSEGEAIRLAYIYEKTGALKLRAQLLTALTSQQNSKSELHWKYQRMAQFELGKTWGQLGEKEKAVTVFGDLLSSSAHTSSWFAIAAQLEKAKLEFSMLKEVGGKANPAIDPICDALIDVQSKRKLHSEPLHLEAALCYVDIKSQQNGKKYFLLQQMRENFFNLDDPLVTEYLSAAAQFPEKEFLYYQYLAYVDAKLLLLEAQKNQDPINMKEARRNFEQLLAESPDDTLKDRICKTLEGLSI